MLKYIPILSIYKKDYLYEKNIFYTIKYTDALCYRGTRDTKR